jgi:hypothetical protein
MTTLSWALCIYCIIGLLVGLIGDMQLRKSDGPHKGGWTQLEWAFVIFVWPLPLFLAAKELWDTRHDG